MSEITTAQALEWFENRNVPMPYAREMYGKAIAALRFQLEAEKNEPLTLKEILQMSGKPVFVTFFYHPNLNCWGYMSGGMFIGYHTNTFVETYGKVWLAYRHKPKDSVYGSDC